ncbi:hypothetical protein E2C01_051292 [Portunus trituberculatus]|uniref:Uncharacterized protein n=1 Tax=Portunus trituberculatus TaxID=210409 RepID=A0A5B7GLE1_PORTR|nr:hypothetical protein [Portunus trituberculatus]
MLGESSYSSPPGYRAFYSTPFPEQSHHGATAILVHVFTKVCRVTGKNSAPSPPVLLSAGQKVADPKTVADLFAEHFDSVSRKDPAAPGAR